MRDHIDRQFIRHASEVPIEYCVTTEPPHCNLDVVNNVSQGGLSFHSENYIEPDQWLHLYIPIHENYFETDAKVCWCEKTHDSDKTQYNIGVRFCNKDEAFSARMVEQVCYIEEYKKKVREKEGRQLSSDQAAAEWIEKYAETFPPAIG